MRNTAAKECRHPAAGRGAARHHRRLRGGLLSDGPGGLRPAVPPADRGQPPRRQGPMPFLVRGGDRRERGSDLHRPCRRGRSRRAFAERLDALAAAARGRVVSRRRVRLRRHGASAPRRALYRAQPARRGRRSSPRATCTTTDAGRRPSRDVLTCIREKCTIQEAGYRLEANAERHLKPPEEMARLFAGLSRRGRAHDGDRRALHIFAERTPLRIPRRTCAAGKDAAAASGRSDLGGAAWRYPKGVPEKVRDSARAELASSRKERSEYFLTVHDIVRFASRRRKKNRFSARGAVGRQQRVCFCLGITAVDPDRSNLLFERFLSNERSEPPDIDVDFEHERREEVIQYIYETLRPRSRRHLRHGDPLSAAQRDSRGRQGDGPDRRRDGCARRALVWGVGRRRDRRTSTSRQAGLDPDNPERPRARSSWRAELLGFPRHLSQHVGGFVLTRETARARPCRSTTRPWTDRTFIEWDKDDIDALGMMKVDVLALGMLTAIRKGLDLIERHYGRSYTLATVPREDPAVYEMLCEGRLGRRLPGREPGADVDAAAAAARMLLRSRHRGGDRAPRADPGRHGPPLSAPARWARAGRLSHPRRSRRYLAKTLGVPLFQEQAMQIAIVAAGFTPDEADGLRRAMATFRHVGTIHTFREKFIAGMVGTATNASSPSAASARSRASASTAFRRATRRASRTWSTSRPGSSAITRTCSAPPSSTASRWASTRRPNSSATPASTASRCATRMST